MREIERFAPGPGAGRELESQHLSRYDFASRFTAGKRVIDIACGTGYGSSLLRRSFSLALRQPERATTAAPASPAAAVEAISPPAPGSR